MAPLFLLLVMTANFLNLRVIKRDAHRCEQADCATIAH
jgi:hypothetical protein